jgi:hypothetical protein
LIRALGLAVAAVILRGTWGLAARIRPAQPAWAATNPQRRARVMFKFKELVEAHG